MHFISNHLKNTVTCNLTFFFTLLNSKEDQLANKKSGMNKRMNENECGEASEVIGMKKYVRPSHFAHF